MKKLFLLTALFICCFKIGYTQPGNADPSFGKNGAVRTDIGAAMTQSTQARQVLLQSDGSIYVVFQTSDLTIIAKKHADSSPDSTYGYQGFSASVKMNTAAAAMQKDGKIVVAGTVKATDGSNYNFALARFNTNGSLDSAFDTDGKLTTDFGGKVDGINQIAIQTDGKIVVTGSTYPTYDVDPKVALARYNTNGSLDNTFDGDGKLETGLQSTDDNYNLAAIQANGKIVVSCLGDSRVIRLARYNSNGSADNTFNSTNSVIGSPEAPFVAKAMALQADGKIVLGGAIPNTNGYSDFALARFAANGKPDSTFGNNAIQTTDFRTFGDVINAIAIQSDGKIVAAGSASKEIDYAFAIARYNTNGSLDNTFDGDGKKMNYIGTYSVSVVSLAIQNNGKLVAAGYNSRYTQSSYLTNIAIAKYNANGSLDSTFHGTGALIDHYGQKNTVFTGSAAQKDGKIVAAGYAWNGKNYDFAVARYNTNGSLDNSFSTDGIVLTDIGSSDNMANAVAVQADGKIVVAGYASNGANNDFAVVRYNTDGSLDKSFSSDGIQTTDFGYREEVNALAIQSDGKIVVAGTLYEQYSSDDDKTGLVRFNTDGSPDKSFSEDGMQTLAYPADRITPSEIAVQSDGKIVVAGTAAYNVFIARYNTNGSLDAAFGYNGITEFAVPNDQDGGFTYGYSVNIQKDGKIVLGAENGFFDRGGKNSDILIARFNSDGSLDNSFSQDGYVELLYSSDNASVKLQNDGKIVVVSNRYDYVNYGNDDYQEIKLGYVLARLTGKGTIDSTFGSNGAQYIPNSENIQIQDIAIANDKLYVVGYGKDVNNYGFLSSYFLKGNKAPTVSITSPANNTVYAAPATITINATATDSDGTVASVKFYNGSTYLKTDFTSPYSYTISNLPAGTYYLTAKATDNTGAQTTSAAIKVIVNKAPIVSITSPANNTVYTAPANITVNAAASDSDGSVYSVKFYNGATYLKTDFTSPYSYTISNLPAGTYSLTVKATDNYGAETISAPVTVTVSNSAIVSSKPYSQNEKTALNDAFYLKLSPNPATHILNINTGGLQPDKPATLSIISVSGNVLKTIRISNSSTSLDVSTLASGVYTIKIVSGIEVKYKQFVKL